MSENTADKDRKPLVLSVDDDKRIQKIIELYLKKGGYGVEFAASGEEALEKLKTIKPDLILLDVMMPGMTGYEVCAKIQENDEAAYIPVIFATALGEERDKAKAFAVGAADYLVKPIKKDNLLEKIKSHLSTSSQWEELGVKDEVPEAAPERPGGARDFGQFKAFLAAQMGLEGEGRKKLEAAAPRRLYDVCRELEVKTSAAAQLLADFKKLPYLSYVNPKDVKLGVLPTRFCRSNLVVALCDAAHDTSFALSNPFDLQLTDALNRFSEQGREFRVVVTEPENIVPLFGDKSEDEVTLIRKAPAADKADLQAAAELKTVRAETDDHLDERVLAEGADEPPVVKKANEILARAVAMGASDLHVEPRRHCLGIRYRIDGMLNEMDPVPKNMAAAVVSRFKIMAELDIANRRIPQDGRIRITFKGRTVDLRVSTLPSRYGEKVVIRIVDNSAMSLDFESLGLMGASLRLFEESIRKPYGILLVTGPTGSGKTTTLYSALQALNEPNKNIITVEDPIENELHRITQVQVNVDAGLTFPAALRSILRQDPDIVMVGEIRDLETADIAIKAALTGHLVLSTLHTNDSPSTIVRLVDMGIDSFLVASALEMVQAQRLLRKLCTFCKKPAEIDEEKLQKYGFQPEAGSEFWEPVGCERCNGTGYKGRAGAMEILVMDPVIRKMIIGGAGVDDLRNYAIESLEMSTLRRDGLTKASMGITSLEEVIRVTG